MAIDTLAALMSRTMPPNVRLGVCDALPIAPPSGTIILRDVDAFDRDQQQRLLRWLDEPQHGHMRVISLTATQLYDLVQARTLLELLYYRLNETQFEVIAG